jgi:hypothetical protein
MGRTYIASEADNYDINTHNPWGNDYSAFWKSDGTPKMNTSNYGLPDFAQTKNFVAKYEGRAGLEWSGTATVACIECAPQHIWGKADATIMQDPYQEWHYPQTKLSLRCQRCGDYT